MLYVLRNDDIARIRRSQILLTIAALKPHIIVCCCCFLAERFKRPLNDNSNEFSIHYVLLKKVVIDNM